MAWQNETLRVNKAATAAGCYMVIPAPSARDGVAGALRSVYPAERNAVPDDMLLLLSMLDK